MEGFGFPSIYPPSVVHIAAEKGRMNGADSPIPDSPLSSAPNSTRIRPAALVSALQPCTDSWRDDRRQKQQEEEEQPSFDESRHDYSDRMVPDILPALPIEPVAAPMDESSAAAGSLHDDNNDYSVGDPTLQDEFILSDEDEDYDASMIQMNRCTAIPNCKRWIFPWTSRTTIMGKTIQQQHAILHLQLPPPP